MKYLEQHLADLLSLLRLILAFVTTIVVLGHYWHVALAVFGAAILTDTLDGICARRWPYTKKQERRLWWRYLIGGEAIDDWADRLLILAAFIGLGLVFKAWLYIGAAILVISIALRAIMTYGGSINSQTGTITESTFKAIEAWLYPLSASLVIAHLLYLAIGPWVIVYAPLAIIGLVTARYAGNERLRELKMAMRSLSKVFRAIKSYIT